MRRTPVLAICTPIQDSLFDIVALTMPKTLTLELPDDAFSALRSSPDEFGRELRLAAAIKWYEMERISQGKAAEIAGLSRSAFIDALGRYGVSPVQVRSDEFEREVEEALGEPVDSSPSVEDDDE
jgi:predicted HTH domain antitoxin